MTRDQIISLAQQAAAKHGHTIRTTDEIVETLTAFAELLAEGRAGRSGRWRWESFPTLRHTIVTDPFGYEYEVRHGELSPLIARMIRSLVDDTNALAKGAEDLVREADRANEIALHEMGVALIDLNVIKRART